jgi:hypothetical protein
LPTKEVRAAAHNADQSWRTIGRAKAELKIKTGRKRDGWPWFLPQDQLGQEENAFATKTLAELARIKKVKKKRLSPAKNSAKPITLAGMLAVIK